MSLTVTVGVVLYNSGPDIASCLAALAAQSRPPDTVVVIDNASRDDGLAKARAAMPDALFERSATNLGFAGGHNRAFAIAPADLHIIINPDCRLAPSFIEQAVAALDADPRIGAVTGRLLRFRPSSPDGGPLEELADDLLDSTGMVGLRNRRVLDRSSESPAHGRDTVAGDVFGASGAAAVYRGAMLHDVAFEGEILDTSFFAYREDVDLAWRAQLLGWRCRYLPGAVARHRRRVTPERRRDLPDLINRLSVANRWRMILKNELASGWRRDWRAILGRDAQILGFCLLREQSSLLAVADVVGDGPRLRARRRDIMRRRKASDEEMLGWFRSDAERPAGSGQESGT